MRYTKFAAALVAGLMVVFGAMAAANAATSYFKSTVTPSTVKVGSSVKIVGTGAKKSTSYTCALLIVKGKGQITTNKGDFAYDVPSIKIVKSSSTGKVACSQKVKKFTATGSVSKKKLTCPVPAALAKKGYHCGIGLANANQTSLSVHTFGTKK